MVGKGSTLISETWSGKEVATARQGQVQVYKQEASKEYFVVMGNPYLPPKLLLHGQVCEIHIYLQSFCYMNRYHVGHFYSKVDYMLEYKNTEKDGFSRRGTYRAGRV